MRFNSFEIFFWIALNRFAVKAESNLIRRREQSSDNGNTSPLKLQLIDASTGATLVKKLQKGTTVYIDSISVKLNIVAVPLDYSQVVAVRFSNGRREGSLPYAYCGDIAAGQSYNACSDLGVGWHDISATAIAPGNKSSETISVSFEIIVKNKENDGDAGENIENNFIAALQLVNVVTNTVILPSLQNGSKVSVSRQEASSLSIHAVPSSDVVTNIVFTSNGQNEGAKPFFYCGDRRGIAKACNNLKEGVNTVSLKALGSGGIQLGSEYSISFIIALNYDEISSVDNNEQAPTGPKAPEVSLENGEWVKVAVNNTCLTARHEACFVFDDLTRRAYLIGGRKRDGTSNPVDIYDPVTKSCSYAKGPPMELHHMQCVAVDGKIWIVSAWTGGFPRERNMANIHIFDTVSGSWSTKAGLPEERRRGGAAAILVGRRIYLSHGNRGGHETDDFAETLGWLDYYDIDSDQWVTNLPDAPNPRDHTGGTLVGGEICIAGGRNGGEVGFFNKVVLPTDCFNLETGLWTVKANIPHGRAGSAYGTTCDGKLVVAGGEGFGKAWNSVDVFNGSFWTTISNLNVARHGTGLAVDCHCNQIYIASGSGSQGGKPELYSIESYIPKGVESQCKA